MTHWLVEKYGRRLALNIVDANIEIAPEGPGGKDLWREIRAEIEAPPRKPISKRAHEEAARYVRSTAERYGPEGALSRLRMMTYEPAYRRKPQWLRQALDLLDALVCEERLKGQPLTMVERDEIINRRAP